MLQGPKTRDTLAIHPGALGDVLLAVPALRALKASFPGDGLALAAQPRIARLLAALGVTDRAIAFDALHLDALFVDDSREPSGPAGLRDGGRAPWPGSGRAPDAALASAARIACWFGGGDPNFTGRLLAIAPSAVIARSTPPGGGLVWEHLTHTIARWASGPPALYPVPMPPAIVGAGRRLLQDAGWDGKSRLLVVHPGAGSASKRWPASAFARVIEEAASPAGFTAVVHEGPADVVAADDLLTHMGRSALRLRQPGLEPLAGALAQAAAYLGNDSGVSHLAAAVGTPATVLFTAAKLDWRPWASARVVLVDCAAVEVADVQRVTDAVRTMLAEFATEGRWQKPRGDGIVP
jgi:ADP-heptose:LPS heptosyltransferase